MPIFERTVAIKDLYQSIYTDILSTGLWLDISSTQSDGCLKSVGSSGRDNIFIILRANNTTTDKTQHCLAIGIAEDYTPGESGSAGTFTNSILGSHHLWTHSTIKFNYNTNVKYMLIVDADCIILATATDKSASSYAATNVAYLGLPLRYSDEADSTANCLAQACSANSANAVRVIRNKAFGTTYTVYSLVAPCNPGWGDKYYASPIIIGNGTEGFRGELKHIFCVPAHNVVDGDTVKIGDKDYAVFLTSSYGNNSFPTRCLLLPKTV